MARFYDKFNPWNKNRERRENEGQARNERRARTIGRLTKDVRSTQKGLRKTTSLKRTNKDYLKDISRVGKKKKYSRSQIRETQDYSELAHKRAIRKGTKAGRKATGRIADPAKQRRHSLGLKGLSTGNTRRRAR